MESPSDDISRLLCVWDLDGTLVDSKHRTMYGKGIVRTPEQLLYWLQMSESLWIEQDTPLPLAHIQRRLATHFGGVHIVLTARTLKEADVAYLREHNLQFDALLHREGTREGNDVMKRKRLADYLYAHPQLIPFLAFDDDEENWQLYKDFGFAVVDPMLLNSALPREINSNEGRGSSLCLE